MTDTPTPSMDNKDIPSPPTRDHAKYQADKETGINPVGHPRDARTAGEEKKP